MNALAAATTIVVALAAWTSFWFVIPSCARSLFRYRLWRLRDDIVDDLRDGRYVDEYQPRLLLREIELAIRAARHLTLFRVCLISVTTRAAPPVDRSEWFDIDKTAPDDRELLSERCAEMHFAISKHVIVGAPSGWLFLLLLFPAFLLYTAIRSAGHPALHEAFGEAKSRVRAHAPDPEPALALLSAKVDTRQLSSYA